MNGHGFSNRTYQLGDDYKVMEEVLCKYNHNDIALSLHVNYDPGFSLCHNP